MRIRDRPRLRALLIEVLEAHNVGDDRTSREVVADAFIERIENGPGRPRTYDADEIIRRRLAGETQEQIARSLGCSLGLVRYHLNRDAKEKESEVRS